MNVSMTPPYPSYQFSEWTAHREGTLKKVKVTIQDVDGECSLKVSGRHAKYCPIAAHYQLPLRALNRKFGLYKKIITHLNGSSNLHAAKVRNTFLSLMVYIKDVFTGFITDARTSANSLGSDFRSPALDYYLWLDHKVDGFDDGSRGRLKLEWNITFEALKKGECEDILEFLDWGAYHKAKCKDHDFCGAIQGRGESEHIQSLLLSVDALMEDLNTPDNVGDVADVEDAEVHSHNQLPVAPSEVTATEDFIDNSRDHDAHETGSMEHVVLAHEAHSYSHREVQAVHPLKEQNIQTAIQYTEHATQSNAYRSCCHQEVYAVPHMRDQMTQTEIDKVPVGHLEGHHSGSGDAVDNAMSPLTDECFVHQYAVDNDDTCWGDTFNTLSGSIEPTSPTTGESFMVVAGDSAHHGIDISAQISTLPAMDVGPPTRTDNDDHTAPLMKSGSRGRRKDSIYTKKPQRKGRNKSPSVAGRPVVFAKQPLIPRRKAGITSPQLKKYTLEDLVSEAHKDTQNIKPHVRAFLLDPQRDDFISKHLQSHHDELLAVANVIASLMCTASLPDDVLPGALSLMSIDIWLADIAHQCQIATDSNKLTLPPLYVGCACADKAHCVLLELSTLARKDKNSVRNTLQTSIWDKNRGSVLKPVILYLCKLRQSHPGADDDYESGFKLLAHMMQGNRLQA